MIKKILYWIMVIAIVVGAVYSYQKVGFGRKIAMLYQLTSGDMTGPGGGRPPMGGGQPGMGPEGGQGQVSPGQSGAQGPRQMQGNMEGRRPDFQPGGRQGGPPQGMGPGGSWYRMSVRNILPYTFILAFFVLMTCVIEKTIKRVFYSKS
jgi:hypothetical protein